MTFLNPRKVYLNDFILNLAYKVLNSILRHVKNFLDFPDVSGQST